jgi:hypothetical protein
MAVQDSVKWFCQRASKMERMGYRDHVTQSARDWETNHCMAVHQLYTDLRTVQASAGEFEAGMRSQDNNYGRFEAFDTVGIFPDSSFEQKGAVGLLPLQPIHLLPNRFSWSL